MHKAATTDDKRLQSTLKRLGVNTIPGIEEVNLFQGNDVVHFLNPKGARACRMGTWQPVLLPACAQPCWANTLVSEAMMYTLCNLLLQASN